MDVVGTIFTNGNGGPITYQWTKDGENLPAARSRPPAASSGPGRPAVVLAGKGTHQAAAIFQVFTPNVISPQQRHLHLHVHLMRR